MSVRLSVRIAGFIAAGSALALVAAGCAASERLSGKAQLDAATKNLSNAKHVSVTVSLKATAAQLASLDGSDPADAADAAKVLSGSKILLTSSRDSSGKSDGSYSIAVLTDQGTVAELRVVDKILYARFSTDVAGKIANAVSPADGADFAKSLAEFESEPVPPAFSFITSAVHGDWLSLDATQTEKALKQFQSSAADPNLPTASASTPSEAQIKQVKVGILDVLRGDVAIQDQGKDSIGEHIELTAPLRTVVTDVMAKLSTLPGYSEFLQGSDFTSSDVPNKSIHVDTWVKDKKLVAVDFDLAQLSTTAGAQPVHLRLDIDNSADSVSAPATSTKIDPAKVLKDYLDQLSTSMSGQGSGVSDSSSGAASSDGASGEASSSITVSSSPVPAISPSN